MDLAAGYPLDAEASLSANDTNVSDLSILPVGRDRWDEERRRERGKEVIDVNRGVKRLWHSFLPLVD